MVEFGHCTIAPPLEGAALALEDEQLGFDIRYFTGTTTPFIRIRSSRSSMRRAPLRGSNWQLGSSPR